VLATLFGIPTNDLPADVPELATQRLHELACSDPKRWIAWEVNPERGRQKAEFTPCPESSATPTPQIALPKLNYCCA
jgi:hypothetical protein